MGPGTLDDASELQALGLHAEGNGNLDAEHRHDRDDGKRGRDAQTATTLRRAAAVATKNIMSDAKPVNSRTLQPRLPGDSGGSAGATERVTTDNAQLAGGLRSGCGCAPYTVEKHWKAVSWLYRAS